MYRSTPFFCHLFSFLAGWSLYSEHYANGMGVLAVSSLGGMISSESRDIDSPFLAARIATNVHDFDIEKSAPAQSLAIVSRCYGGGESYMSDNDINIIKSNWNFLKSRLSDFAPKVFLRYLQTRPGARKLFPAFANVKIAELPTNRDFLSAAYNCIASLTYIIPHLKCDLLERCPAFSKLRIKGNNVDFKKFGNIWVNTIHEEMSNNTFNNDLLRDAWKKAFMAIRKYATV